MKNGLPEHEIPIWRPYEVMQSVVRVFTAESGKYDFPMVSLIVSIRIGEVDQMRFLRDVDAVSPENEGEGDCQIIGKHRRLVGLTVSIEIFKDYDFVIGLFARIEMGIGC